MATVDVYNLDSVKARTIFSMAKQEDILQTQIICMAKVKIPDVDFTSRSWAYFDETYQGAGNLSRPYMVVKGSVSEVFIEDNDPRTFPCGAKNLVIKAFDAEYPDKREDIPVKIVWKLTADEIAYLYSRGLGYSDFGPPSMLRGNIIEIPVNIVYKAVYETPICAIRIVDPGRIETSTLYNRYDTIFMNCEVSQELIHEKTHGVAIAFNYDNTIVNEYEENVDYQVDEISEEQINAINDIDQEMTDDEKRDAIISSDIETKMQDAADKDMEARDDKDVGFSVMDLLSSIKSDIAEQEIEDSDDYYAEVPEQKGTLKLSDRIDMLKAKTTDNSENSSAGADKTDGLDTRDDQASDTLDDFESFKNQTLSETEASHKKSEKQARKLQENIRRLDIALDNQALNRGETDISGFGAGDNKDKPDERSVGNKLTESLFSDILDNKPSMPEAPSEDKPSGGNNGPRFL